MPVQVSILLVQVAAMTLTSTTTVKAQLGPVSLEQCANTYTSNEATYKYCQHFGHPFSHRTFFSLHSPPRFLFYLAVSSFSRQQVENKARPISRAG